MYLYKKQKIGLFGGSFNPPHKAHMLLANYAIKELKLDLLIFIPVYKSVDKECIEYLENRERKYMIDISRSKKKTIISDFEINLKRPAQSIETVKYFKNRFNESHLFFLLGDDHLPTLHTWEKLEDIFRLATLVIFKRLKKFPEINFSQELFSQLLFLNNKIYEHSSSTFRKRLNFTLLHKKVAKYIKWKKYWYRYFYAFWTANFRFFHQSPKLENSGLDSLSLVVKK